MLFEATRPHEVTKGMSIDNEEKRSKDVVLEYSNVKKMRSNKKKKLTSNQ